MLFLDRAAEVDALARQRPDEALCFAAVADGAACRIDARGECLIRDEPTVPDDSDEIVLADDAITIADQIYEEIELLRGVRRVPRNEGRSRHIRACSSSNRCAEGTIGCSRAKLLALVKEAKRTGVVQEAFEQSGLKSGVRVAPE